MGFLGPSGEEWNCSLQMEQRAILTSASATGSRNTSFSMPSIMLLSARLVLKTPSMSAIAC